MLSVKPQRWEQEGEVLSGLSAGQARGTKPGETGKARQTGWEKRGEGEDPKIKLTVLYAPGVVSRDTPDKTFFWIF